MKNRKKILYLFSTITLMSYCQYSFSQNTSSPYSILGIGDLSTGNNGRYSSMANASTALRDPTAINTDNPASLTALTRKMMYFETNMHGRNSRFLLNNTDTFTSATKDMTITRVALAFTVSRKLSFAVGLKPFSTVNYAFDLTEKLFNGEVQYDKNIEGSGGINDFFISGARTLGKNFSIGFSASTLFGSVQRTTDYSSASLGLNIRRAEYEKMLGFSFKPGIQFHKKTKGLFEHKAGITIAINTKIQNSYENEYIESDVTIKKSAGDRAGFSLPVAIQGGYAITFPADITISSDFKYQYWKQQSLIGNETVQTQPYGRVALGVEYSNKVRMPGNIYREKFYINAGVSASNNYMLMNNQNLNDYTFTAGAGVNSHHFLTIYGGFGFGVRGNHNKGMLQENYSLFNIGILIRETGLISSKYW